MIKKPKPPRPTPNERKPIDVLAEKIATRDPAPVSRIEACPVCGNAAVNRVCLACGNGIVVIV